MRRAFLLLFELAVWAGVIFLLGGYVIVRVIRAGYRFLDWIKGR